MTARLLGTLYRLSAILTAGMMLGSGCYGPNDLQTTVAGTTSVMINNIVVVVLTNLVNTIFGLNFELS